MGGSPLSLCGVGCGISVPGLTQPQRPVRASVDISWASWLSACLESGREGSPLLGQPTGRCLRPGVTFFHPSPYMEALRSIRLDSRLLVTVLPSLWFVTELVIMAEHGIRCAIVPRGLPDDLSTACESAWDQRRAARSFPPAISMWCWQDCELGLASRPDGCLMASSPTARSPGPAQDARPLAQGLDDPGGRVLANALTDAPAPSHCRFWL